MSVTSDRNQYGLRGITVTEARPDVAEPDQLRIGGNIADVEHTVGLTVFGPRGAIKASMRLGLDDLAEMGIALSAIAAELKATKP